MADDTVVVHSLLRILFTKYEYVRILTEAFAYKLPWYEADMNMKYLGIKSIKNKILISEKEFMWKYVLTSKNSFHMPYKTWDF